MAKRARHERATNGRPRLLVTPVQPLRYEIEHPERGDTALVYGWDRERGYFVEVVSRGAPVFACRVGDKSEQEAMHDVLGWTLEYGFFTSEEIAAVTEALGAKSFMTLSSPRLRSLAMLVVRFNHALARSTGSER